MYTRDNNTCEEFENVIKDLTINPTVQKMKEFRQHYNTSCYEHCLNVAFYSYLIAKKLKLDPAIMAGPLITTLVDSFALIIYFSIASMFLGL